MKISKLLMLAVIFIISLSAYTCLAASITVTPGNIGEDKKAAEAQIKLFHERYNDDDFETIYDECSDYLKNNQRREGFIKVAKSCREKFGNFNEVSDQRVRFIMGSPIQVRSVCVSLFDKGEVTEQFIFVKEGSEMKLLVYKGTPGAVDLSGIDND